MKSGAREILGKTIKAIIEKESDDGLPPRSQVFLVFTDGTYFELYSSHSIICGTNGVDKGGVEEVRAYMPEHRIVFEAGTY